MFITLHCGGIPFDGTTVKEKSLGGSESAAYYMAKELTEAGHKVTLFTTIDKASESDGVKYVPSGNITEAAPLGENFHHYAENTPCDVLIIQRHPIAFRFKYASKINLWWTHDLALIRNQKMVQEQMWNVDGILTVSEWHKEQLVGVYGVNPDIVYPITNGVDLSLFEGSLSQIEPAIDNSKIPQDQFKMLYTSRPERGLENLVKVKGVMEQLHKIDSKYHLYVCGYDNTTPQMREHYKILWDRCIELPNVTLMGSLTKPQLADVMRQCDLHIYPSTFEETSCITAMECMAAGLPMLASHVGALPETTHKAGAKLISLNKNEVSIDAFTKAVLNLAPHQLVKLQNSQKEKAPHYSWLNAFKRLQIVINKCFNKHNNDATKIRELIQTSDYYAAFDYAFNYLADIEKDLSPIMGKIINELSDCYGFTKEDIWDKHYEEYYKYEKDRGIEYGPEEMRGNRRFDFISSLIGSLDDDSIILDYGCAHGHYTITLAKQYPEKHFIGIDITESNIITAREWAKQEGLSNIAFYKGRVEGDKVKICYTSATDEPSESDIPLTSVDCIIAAEVLEHVADPGGHVDTLKKYLKDNGRFIITTPYGPWEAIGYKEHWPWRAHVHHFEREDLHSLWGHFPLFEIFNIPSGKTKHADNLGSYVTVFVNDVDKVSGTINYQEKLEHIVPSQTLTCCMIVKDAPSTIRKCLESVMPYVEEIVIGFDEDTDGETIDIASSYLGEHWPEKACTLFEIESPLKIGFDSARNLTLDKANGDWIIWLDSDEELYGGPNIKKYLRNNQFNGYAIHQYHFSMQPTGILKTDMPVKIFRNNKDIKFIGRVHEHPEQKMNEGVGYATVLDDIGIRHDGYYDEETRRKRFSRNVGLMKRDRKENPNRTLGKFLWIRDLAQMCQWELESNGANITPIMIERAHEGIALWEEILEKKEIRLLVDSLEYLSSLNRVIGNGFEVAFKLDTAKNGRTDLNTIKEVMGYFTNVEHAKKLNNIIFEERTKQYESKYL